MAGSRTVVVSITDARTLSGPLRQTIMLAHALAAGGVDLRVCVPHFADATVDAFAAASGITIHRFMYGPARSGFRGLKAFIARHAPDIVQTHSYKPDIAVALGRRSIRAPWIVVHHGVTAEGARVRAYHALDRLASLRADAVVCVSPSQRARFAGARGPVLVIANAALMGTIPELDEVPATPPSLRFVGRLSHEKGADRALRLLAALRGDGTPIAMDVVGDGPSMGELQRLADSLGVAAHVRWHGHVAAPWRGASAHDLLVLPSRSEGMPNALFEATIVGMRHVAADVGDVASMHAAAPAAGVVVPSTDDPHVWREAARRALALPWHADDRRAARDALVAQFGVEARASRFAELYARLLGAPRGEA